ncbi:hypothetical protein LTR62_005049 [Meristemomyces frigidus]|uniref:Uncharacterized protein n=1 Tax=Meristemomyces frigidus TaxID=1508187 RepID=A0AAN7TWC7_9PEZI|nr:hypothetical protein LTR62_005049 [Meristemomyces frigidus]
MLGRIEECQQVTFDEYRWRVSYAMPDHGKDFWTRRMEDKAKEEEQSKEDTLKQKRKRFSLPLNRKSKAKSVRSARTND